MSSTRRDAGRARGKAIEEAILVAALDELAAHGLEGLSIPRIAGTAQVNKTSIYRRWATREELIGAALQAALSETTASLADTGSLRGDLSSLIEMLGARLATASGRALARAAMSERSAAEVIALSGSALVRELEAGRALVERAVARGEWDVEVHAPEAVLAMLAGSAMHRALIERQPLTASWVATVVDVVARGVAAPREAPVRPRERDKRAPAVRSRAGTRAS